MLNHCPKCWPADAYQRNGDHCAECGTRTETATGDHEARLLYEMLDSMSTTLDEYRDLLLEHGILERPRTSPALHVIDGGKQ